jgi:membrane protein DedA with SNARE-associated domain
MWGYLLIIGFASIGHYALPYPQEAVFATAGYIAAHYGLNVWLALATCITASFAGDFLVYYLARGGSHVIAHLVTGFPESDIARVRNLIGRRTLVTIMLLRMFPMTRMLVAIVAGVARVPARTYAIADAATLLLLTPIYFMLGHNSYATVMAYLQSPSQWLPWLAALAVVAVGYAAYMMMGRRHRHPKEMK